MEHLQYREFTNGWRSGTLQTLNFLTESQLKSSETPVKPVGSLSFAAEQAAISLKPAGGFDYKSTAFDG